MSRCIAPFTDTGVPRIVFYMPGIGTGTVAVGQCWECLTGKGLCDDIREAYSFLCHNYDDNDKIFLVGYSSGAFTVRCVAQLIQDVGLLKKRGLPLLPELFGLWKKKTKAKSIWSLKSTPLPVDLLQRKIADLKEADAIRHDIKIRACAVWETVSSLGLPMPFFIPHLFSQKLAFVNSDLCPNIENAFQALALQERRRSFRPIVWKVPSGVRRNAEAGSGDTVDHGDETAHHDEPLNPSSQAQRQNLKQCWFLGYHRDVGGGEEEAALSHISLIWMVSQLTGLLHFNMVNVLPPGIEIHEAHDEMAAKAAEPRVLRTETKLTVDASMLLISGFGVSIKLMRELRGLNIRLPDSLRGVFKLGGSKPRQPCRRFHSSTRVYKADEPSSTHGNEKIHFTARLLLADETICPSASLTRASTAIQDGRVVWSMPGARKKRMVPWSGRSPYFVDEEQPESSEVDLLKQWLCISRGWLIHEAKQKGGDKGEQYSLQVAEEEGVKLRNIAFPLFRRLDSSDDMIPVGEDAHWDAGLKERRERSTTKEKLKLSITVFTKILCIPMWSVKPASPYEGGKFRAWVKKTDWKFKALGLPEVVL